MAPSNKPKQVLQSKSRAAKAASAKPPFTNGVPDAMRLRELEGENAKLEKLLAKAYLDKYALKGVLGVKR